jgi:hypothetical protein
MQVRFGSPTSARGGRRFLPYLLGLLAAYLVLTGLSTFWTDFLWHNSVGYANVWWTRQIARWALIGGTIAISFLVIYVNLGLAQRSTSRHLTLPESEEGDELLNRIRESVSGRLPVLWMATSVVMALLIGGGAGGWTEPLFLFINRIPFGVDDPIFGNDLGFYIFTLPMVRNVLAWAFNLLLVTTLLVVAAYYVNGALRLHRRGGSFFTRGAKLQVSLLLAALVLVRAGLYRLDAFQLLYSNRNTRFFGAGFTDVNARLPVMQLLLWTAVVAAVLLIINIWRQGWTLPLVAGGAWFLISIGAGVIYPAAIEKFQVEPNPLERQTGYIARNIEFTRRAFGLDQVSVREFAADDVIAPEELAAAAPAFDNLRLWDLDVLANTYSPQEFREYYRLAQVDSDRYMIDDELTQVMLSVRELETEQTEDSWLVRRLSYTHGFGLVSSYAAKVATNGAPSYLLSELPPEATAEELALEEPRIYFGELDLADNEPVIVANATGEIDYPTGQNTFASSSYEGLGGVELSSIWRRLAFGLRFRDLNMVLSDQILPTSKILMERDIDAIIAELVPFLARDSDPYAVIVDGRVKWVVDLFTYSGNYPYSTPISGPDRRRLERDTGLVAGINYLRNSVKAVIDAYDGTTIFYAVDEADPILAAWRSTFPSLFVGLSAMPEELRSHLRYPLDLLTIQSELYRDYHVTDVPSFYNEVDRWSIPLAGAFGENENPLRGPGVTLVGDGPSAATGQVEYVEETLPYYTLLDLDGKLQYVALQSFAPRDEENLAGFLTVSSDPDNYGEMIDYRMPSGSQVAGIEQVALRIEGQPEIAQQFSLWRTRGSQVLQGDILVIPIGDSLLYAQAIFLEAAGGGIPEFERIIVVFEDRIEWSTSLASALALVFGDEVGEPSEPEPSGDVAALLERAEQAFADAEAALRAGDLAGYQRLVEEARALIEQARDLLGSESEARRLSAHV